MYDEEEEMYRDYYKQMNAVEEEREIIEMKLRKVREQQSWLEEVFRERHYFFWESVKHCDVEDFLLGMGTARDK